MANTPSARACSRSVRTSSDLEQRGHRGPVGLGGGEEHVRALVAEDVVAVGRPATADVVGCVDDEPTGDGGDIAHLDDLGRPVERSGASGVPGAEGDGVTGAGERAADGAATED